MTHNNPFNLIPLQPTGRNTTDNVNTYAPEDMIKIYEQQFLTPVAADQLTEFLPALKGFYDIDDNTLDICAIIFDVLAESCIIYNHKIKAGDYAILEGLVKEDLEVDQDAIDSLGDDYQETQAYTLECMRTFFINEVEIPYQFNLFIHGDGYSTLTRKNSLLEKIYWLVNDGFDEHLLGDPNEQQSLDSINEQLISLGIGEMDLSTVHEIVNYVEDHLIDDDMIEVLNKLLDAAE